MKRVVALTCLSFVAWSASAQNPTKTEPYYAKHAVYVYPDGSSSSPDGKDVVSLRLLNANPNSESFPAADVVVRTPTAALKSRIRSGLGAQVLWRDDSRAFAITGSAEGGNGQFRTDICYIHAGRLSRVPLTLLIERAFGHPVKCGWPEPPNVAAIKWLHNSRELLVAAEVIGHTNCDSMGTFRGFVVDVPSARVVRSYTQIEVKRLFGPDLAPRLRDANDECILDPPSCYVSTNHPEL